MADESAVPLAFSPEESRQIRQLLSGGEPAPPCPRCGGPLGTDCVEIGRKIKLIPFTPVATVAGTRWRAWCQPCNRAVCFSELPGGRWVDLAE